MVQQVLCGVSVVGVWLPVCPAAVVPAGMLVFGAALRTIVQGYQEAGLGVGFGARFGEAVVGVESFVVTYPVGDGAQGLPHLSVGCGARQLSLVIQSTAIQLREGGAAASYARNGASQALGADRSSPGGADEAVGTGGLAEGFDQFVSRPSVQAAGGRGVGQTVGVSVQRELILSERGQGHLLGQRGLLKDPCVQSCVVFARGRRLQIQKI